MTEPSKQPDSSSVPDNSSDKLQAPKSDATLPEQEAAQQDAPAKQPSDSESSAGEEAASAEVVPVEIVPTEPSAVEPSAVESSAVESSATEPAPQVAESSVVAGEAEATSGTQPTTQPADAPTATQPAPPSSSSTEVAAPSTTAAPLPESPPATTPGLTEPVPGAQRPRGSRRGVLVAVTLLAVLLLVVCGVVGYLFLERASENSAHKTGKCVVQSGNNAKPADCDAKGAYKIIRRLDNTQNGKGCPTPQTELYFVNESPDYVLCLKRKNP